MATKHYYGVPVSGDHYTVLKAYEAKYTRVHLNDGRRTLAIQRQRIRDHGLWSPSNPTGAAPANPASPHIKFGRKHHALDIQAGTAPGYSQHVASFYRSLGIPVAFNVLPNEPWHMDTLSASALGRAARKLRRRHDPVIRPGAKGKKVRKLKWLMWRAGIRNFKVRTGVYGPDAVAGIKRFQRKHHLTADGIVGPSTYRALRRTVK